MAGRSIELDVRPYHARGEEPFPAIMEAVSSLGPEDVFVLVNSFEPVPLYGVLARLGFRHRSEEVAPGLWRVTFWRADIADATGAGAAGRGDGREPSAEPRVLELDNRGLAPPEPMLRVLERLGELRPGDRLVVRNDRRPLFLYPELAERGFRHHTEDLPDGTVRVVIWRD